MKKVLLLLIAGATIALLAPSSANAAKASGPSRVGTSIENDILWFVASVPDLEAEKVRVTIFTSGHRHNSRSLLQHCFFDYSGAHNYYCGLHIGETEHRTGAWIAKVLIDGKVAAVTKVRV